LAISGLTSADHADLRLLDQLGILDRKVPPALVAVIEHLHGLAVASRMKPDSCARAGLVELDQVRAEFGSKMFGRISTGAWISSRRKRFGGGSASR